MTRRFFKNVKNQMELRKAYVLLLKQYHPDNGGDPETCKQLNIEYEDLMKELPKTGGENQSQADRQAAADLDKELRAALEKIIHLEGINIEIVGTWIWLDGNTFAHRETLKSLGYRWSKSRKKWHFTPYAEPMYYKGKKKSFNTLRKLYGSSTISPELQPLLS